MKDKSLFRSATVYFAAGLALVPELDPVQVQAFLCEHNATVFRGIAAAVLLLRLKTRQPLRMKRKPKFDSVINL